MTLDRERGQHVPKFDGPPPIDFVCPGAGMDMVGLARDRHGELPRDPMLGTYIRTRAAFAADPERRARAASGGVIPALLDHLFATGQIDCAYCVQPGTAPDTASGIVIRRSTELGRLHGSVYHPVNFGAGLHELVNGSERFAFVGLPCEVAALEMLKRRRPDLARRHVISLGLFCGGINLFKGVAYYLAGFGIDGAEVESISYRDGPWPGKIRAQVKGRSAPVEIPRIRGNGRWKILRYVIAFQGYWMLPRCRICPDQVADFADIAVGDPHLPRFRARGGEGFSAVVSRTARGEAMLQSAIAAGVLGVEELAPSEVVESQGYTLDNRRHARVYARVARWLGMTPPELTVYPEFSKRSRLRHWIYALVDLGKIRCSRVRFLRPLYIPWQVFEYLFLTFTPQLVIRRLGKLLRNRE